MANRIQLRRDHSTNWTRINPVLSDGEPGLEIDTNKVKYGDGSTAWRDLAYASVTVDPLGYVKLPGGMIVGTINSTGEDREQVVWATTDTEYLGLWWGNNNKYPDSGYGAYAGIHIGTDAAPDDMLDNPPENTQINFNIGTEWNWWMDATGNFNIPVGGDIKRNGTSVLSGSGAPDFFNLGNANLTLHPHQIQIGNNLNGYETEEGSGIFRIDATGVDTSQLVSGSYTVSLNSGTGILTVPGFMNLTYGQGGADTMNFGTGPGGGSVNATAGKSIYLTTDGGNGLWEFGSDGVLNLSTSSTIVGNNLDPNVYIETITSSTTSTWTFGTDGSTSFPNPLNGTKSQIYTTNLGRQTVFETWSSAQGNGQKLVLDWDNASVQIQSWPGKQWTFAQDGTLTLPLDNKLKGIHIAQVGEILITGVEAYTSYVTGNTYSWHYADDPVFTTALNNGFLLPGNKVFPVGHLEQAVAIVGVGGGDDLQVAFDGPLGAGPYTIASANYVPEHWAPITIESNTATWTFAGDGSLTLPGLMTLPVSTSTPAISTSTGTVAICDGVGWNGGGDGLEHLMVYINGSWTKVV
jgi:Major tropism determinant N-terminal domain